MKKIPMRRCTGCGTSKPKRELLRIVRSDETNVSFDPGGRSNGRGAYICKDIDCLNKALKTKRLERSLEVTLGDELINELKKMFDDG